MARSFLLVRSTFALCAFLSLAACPIDKEESPELGCDSQNHCHYDDNGKPVCDAGYEFEAPDDQDNLRCIPTIASCAPDPCNGHGTCADTTGAAVCSCNSNWASPWCTTCQTGYYEHPAGSGTCVEDPCLPDPCNGHGSCANTTGAAACRCSAGFDGSGCDACTDGGFGTYPNCFVPGPGYCATSQCWLVPPTEQTTCYNVSTSITCPGTAGSGTCDATAYCGQDAQYSNNPRTYTCYSSSTLQSPCDATADTDEVVTDSLTGLMWQRTWATGKTWQLALDYCVGLNYGGYTDWRLPSPHELSSLVNAERYSPAIDITAFPETPTDYFWTSSSAAYNSTIEACYVNFDTGRVISNDKNSTYSVRCVRLGPEEGAGGGDRYAVTEPVAGQQVVSDAVTGLMWTQQYATGKSWQTALAYCEGLSYAGFDNWRLPDRNELHSLVKYDVYHPASEMPDMPSDGFWSSSAYAGSFNAGYAWGVNFYDGSVTYGDRGHYSSARCVRLGP
jgi:hypothetical protein